MLLGLPTVCAAQVRAPPVERGELVTCLANDPHALDDGCLDPTIASHDGQIDRFGHALLKGLWAGQGITTPPFALQCWANRGHAGRDAQQHAEERDARANDLRKKPPPAVLGRVSRALQVVSSVSAFGGSVRTHSATARVPAHQR